MGDANEGDAKAAGSLGERMRAERKLEARELEKVLRSALTSLQKMHASRPVVVHGAITPDAIVVDDAGAVKLVAAEAMQGREGYRDGPRAPLGYAPIEQVLGRALPSSDLYALAMSLVAAATLREPGALPIDERTARVDVAKVLPNLEPRVRVALEWMLEPVPGNRVSSASEVLARLDGRGGVRAWTNVIVGLVAAVATCFVVLAFSSRSSSPPPVEPQASAPAPKKTTAHDLWAAYSEVTADVDGDGAREVIAWDHGGALFEVGGKTGELAWHTTTSSRRFFVNDVLVVGAPDKGFSVTAFDVKTGKELWEKKLDDALSGVSFGDGCLVLTLRSDQGVSLGNDGAARPCPSAPRPPPYSYRDRAAPLTVDGITLLFASVGAGTSRLGVERVAAGKHLGDGGAAAMESFAKRVTDARRGGKDAGVPTMWSITLDVASEQPRDDGISLAPSGLLLAATDREKHGHHVFLLDPDTGETRKHARLCDYVNVSMPSLQRISRDLIRVHCEGELAAIDEATLDVKWTAGRSRP